MGLRDFDDLLDGGAQVSVIDPFQCREVVEIVKINQVIDQHRIVERLLVEVETLESR